MTTIWKPTQAQCDLIRRAAAREAGATSRFSLKLEPGRRWNIDTKTGPIEMNIALISDHPNWDDTDLYDLGSWKDFRAGVPLTEDGRAIVDFYISPRVEGRDLHGNVTVYFEGGKIARIHGYPGEYPVEE